MAITRFSGPIMSGFPGSSGDSNPTPGPQMSNHGYAMLDQRYTPAGGEVTTIFPCLFGGTDLCVLDFAPSTLSAVNIVPAAVPSAGVAMTLAAASTGITVVPAGGFQLMPTMGTIPANALMIDSNPAFIQLGTLGGGVSMYDPRTMSMRCLTATSVGDDHLATLSIVGYDFYGQIMHQTLTLTNASTATTTKAFKAVVSVTPAGTLSGSNVSLGTSDVYGFGLAAWDWGSTYIVWNNIVSTITGFTAAVATTPSATTGDVRGTYLLQSTASNGTRKLQLFVVPQAWNLTQFLLWGATQF